MSGKVKFNPIVSKIYCSSTQSVLTVRRRPHVVNGGGFVVTNANQKVVFKVEGCGTLGTKGQLILKDGEGETLLYIRRQGGMVEVLSVYKQWKGYMINYEGKQKPIFSLKEPASFLVKNNPIKMTVEPRRSKKDWDFELKGSFPDRTTSIVDSTGTIVAQVIKVGVKEEVDAVMVSKDVYHVVVQPGFDQAFVLGVIAVLDNIHDESTGC